MNVASGNLVARNIGQVTAEHLVFKEQDPGDL